MRLAIVNIMVALTIVFPRFVAVGSSQSNDNGIDYDFFASKGFEKIVRSIVQETENADVSCKVEHGLGSYYSYIGSCDNCSKYCSGPTAYEKDVCFRDCLIFMVELKIKQQNEKHEREVKNLTSQLEAQGIKIEQQNEQHETRVEQLTSQLEAQDFKINIIIGAVILLASVVVVVGFCYHKFYVLPRSKPRRSNHGHPDGDLMFPTQLSEAGAQDNRSDDGYDTTAASRVTISEVSRREVLPQLSCGPFQSCCP